ncbi:MAG: amidohydrolase family protein [Ignavibacteriaceae bacterium]
MKNNMWFLNICITIFFMSAITSYSQTDADRILLKNYRPKSIYKVPVSNIEKAKYPIIDMHSHPYAKTPEEIDQWVETMDKVGIEKTILLTKSYGAKFDSIVAAYSKYPDRFELWCGIDYTGYDQPGFGPNAVAELERCFNTGAKGVGELGDKGKGLFYCTPKAYGMHVDDPRLDPVWEKCVELGMPVNIHVGEPQWFYEPMDSTNDGLMTALEWRLDNQEGILNLPEVVNTLENTVAKHPNTTFIACHLANCNHDLEPLGRLFDKYPNLYADFSARYAENAPVPKYTAKFFNKYQDRLIYGTDMGFEEDMYKVTFRILESDDEHFYEYEEFGYHWALNGFGLNDNVLQKIYRENAIKIITK